MERITKLILLMATLIPLSCIADIAVVVNVNNPSNAISISELKNIYRVRISEFSDENPITLSYQPAASETTQHFFRLVIGKSMAQISRVWARKIFSGRMRRPIKLVDDSLVIQWIAKNRNGIGYIDAANLTENVKEILIIETSVK